MSWLALRNDIEPLVSTFTRRVDIAKLLEPGGIGVELGVGEGGFSERILRYSDLSYLYSIDAWAGDRAHDIAEYKKAIQHLEPHKMRNSILRMRFDEAVNLFSNDYFDFIYVDGYAHTGEEGGQTFKDWFPKLKKGGIFAGDDYSPDWPLVVAEVDKFIKEHDLKLYVINCHEGTDKYSYHPTWFAIKK